VALGKVKRFDTSRGYGFILPNDGGRDVFVHITAVLKAGYTDLMEGALVSYEVQPDRKDKGKMVASNLRLG
jgi:cold shock protein